VDDNIEQHDWDLTQMGEVNTNTAIKQWLYVLVPNALESVVHKDERGIFLIAFEAMNHAIRVHNEYMDATGHKANIEPFDMTDLAEDCGVRLYKLDGTWRDYTHEEYMRRLMLRQRFEKLESENQ
jgi:hypothetical protein